MCSYGKKHYIVFTHESSYHHYLTMMVDVDDLYRNQPGLISVIWKQGELFLPVTKL